MTRIADPAALGAVIRAARGLTFLHSKTALGAMRDLPRPKLSPSQVVQRLRQQLLDADTAR